ncbi:MAG TPA: hypothetical protein VJ998_10690 [Pseudomonadales bacterium]|nr:hypothetical protein [Pseudomonadales bacterium]
MPGERRQQRAQDTRNNLMRAAEQLVAERGFENVTVRAINELAEQKNESALQYHFGNFAGLINEIRQQRFAQVEERRTALLERLLEQETEPSLRELCRLVVGAPFELAREDESYRTYVRGFGRELALTDQPAMEYIPPPLQRGTREIRRRLMLALSHIDEKILLERLDTAARLAGLSLSRHARANNAFRGKQAERWFNRLVDMMVGLISAEVSTESAS